MGGGEWLVGWLVGLGGNEGGERGEGEGKGRGRERGWNTIVGPSDVIVVVGGGPRKQEHALETREAG